MKYIRSYTVGDVEHKEHREDHPQSFIGPVWPEGVDCDKQFIINGTFHGLKHYPSENHPMTCHYFKDTRDVVYAKSLKEAVEFVYSSWKLESSRDPDIAEITWKLTSYQELPMDVKTLFHDNFLTQQNWAI